MTQPFRVLVVDDEQLYAQAIARELERDGVESDVALTARAAVERAGAGSYQAILLDHRLPDDDGIRIIPTLLARQPGTALVMMTAYHTIPNAVRAIRQGAEDYIVKQTSIRPVVERVLELRRREEARHVADDRQEHEREGLVGRSAEMLRAIEQLRRIAASPDTTVLLNGETGVGKRTAARYLHKLTDEQRPLVAVDCASLPHHGAESLLFGHDKGAFAGADETRRGALEQAEEGTLLLEDVAELGELQGKLLRVLETGTFRRLGSPKEIPLRARVVASTRRDLAQLAERGAFRADLHQALAVFPIPIPPLRERGDDISLLAEHFQSLFGQKLGKTTAPLAEEVGERLLGYSFPGNVRELRHIMERAVIMVEGERIELRHLPQRVLNEPHRGAESSASIPLDFVPGIDTLEALERRMIRQAMRRANNVKTEAAKLLGISRYQLLRRLEKYGMRGEGDG